MLDLFKRKSADEEKKPWTTRLSEGLARSREKLTGTLTVAFSRRKLDEETLDELETALLTADVGVSATEAVLQDLRERWKRAGPNDDPKEQLKAAPADSLEELTRNDRPTGRLAHVRRAPGRSCKAAHLAHERTRARQEP